MSKSAGAVATDAMTGRFDGITEGVAFGWALVPGELKRKLGIELLRGDTVVAGGVADHLRQDLQRKGIGDGHYGFAIPLPAALADGRVHMLRARVAKLNLPLQGAHEFAKGHGPAGVIQGISAGVIFGWLANAEASKRPSEMAFSVDGKQVAKIRATVIREDLYGPARAAKALGFYFDLSPFLRGKPDCRIDAVDLASGRPLDGSPLALTPHSAWGCLDALQGVEAGGWVVSADPEAKQAQIELLVDGESIGVTTPDLPRPELRALGALRNRCGFRMAIPPRFYDGREHMLAVRVLDNNLSIQNNGRPFSIELASNIDIFESGRVAGWITNLRAPLAPVRMDLWVDGESLGTLVADQSRPDVVAALKLPRNAAGAGFDFPLPLARVPGQVRRLKLCAPGSSDAFNGRELLLIQRHELIREAEDIAAAVRNGNGRGGAGQTPELLQFLMPQWVESLRRTYAGGKPLYRELPEEPHPAMGSAQHAVVDVIIPVYGGYDETLACIASALRSIVVTEMELVVINDASPDAKLREALRRLAATKKFTLLENEKNVGFVATVNRGMRLHSDRDVVLLNADTLAPPGWLARLKAAAYAEPNIGSATPLSNRATILSLPETLVDNDMPAGLDVADMDALCRETNAGVRVQIPTGVGFCMYIKREALRTVGLFDEARWGKGYAEENDFCVRASALGWRHVAACDVFVQHHGAVSFAGDKAALVQKNLDKLNALYPDYPERVTAFIAADPLREVRARVNRRLMRRLAPRFMLHVFHGWGGGVEIAVRDLCARLAMDKECALVLRSSPGGGMLLSLPGGALPVGYAAGVSMAELCKDLRALGIWHVHIHQTVGLSKEVWQIPAKLKVAYDFTVHDYFSVCPRVNLINASGVFCGQPDLPTCEQCVSADTLDAETRALYLELGGTVAAWRKFHLVKLKSARALFAPSEDTAQRMARYGRLPQLRHKPHPESPIVFHPRPHAKRGPLRVAIIGAIGPHKGHQLLLATAVAAKRKKLPIEFVVVGYTCDDGAYAGFGNVEILGEYKQETLPGLLAGAGCTVALFLSIWPETYSYTLSEALRAGLVPVAIDLGAQSERIKRDKTGITISANPGPEEVLAACQRAGAGIATKKKTIACEIYDEVLRSYYAIKAPPTRRIRK